MGLNACRIPKAVTINGVRYPVKEVPHNELLESWEEDNEIKPEEGSLFFGRLTLKESTIYLNETLPALTKWRAFAHEVIHAMEDASGGPVQEESARKLETAMAWLLNRSNWEY